MMRKLLFIIFLFFYSFPVYAQNDDAMELVINISAAGSSINLPLDGSVDVHVDWGDGSSEDINVSGKLPHTYDSSGEYTVSITGKLTHFGRDDTRMLYLKEIKSWGKLGLTSLAYACRYVYYSVNMPDSIPQSVTDLNHMFEFASYYNYNSKGLSYNIKGLSSWDVSNVTDMSYMFYYASSFSGDLSSWDVSNVTDMSYMFYRGAVFNGDISSWDVSNVTDMSYMFYYAFSFSGDLSSWDVSNVTNMRAMFSSTQVFNGDISSWDVSNVTNMREMFADANSFNRNISSWDVSNVTNMSYMFYSTEVFNGDISRWDVSNVTNMSTMFYSAKVFNGDISSWDVSNVTNMGAMFLDAGNFNGDISSWDVSNVTNMNTMFYSAEVFNGDISSWDVSNVTDMESMFSSAINFNGDLSSWDVSNVSDMWKMFQGVTLSTENYSNMLISWSELELKRRVFFDGGNSQYNAAGAEARQKIIDGFNWSITDGGKSMLFPDIAVEMEEDSTLIIKWSVEKDAYGYLFEIQRQYEIGDETTEWTMIGSVEGDSSKYYSFVDDQRPDVNDLYYRLKRIDEEGAYTYSETIHILMSDITDVEDIEDQDEPIPSEFGLSQNYPNPFNPTTSIEYRVSSSENVSIKVYNMLGQEVMTLVNEVKSPGTYTVMMDGSQLASGIYIYRMTAGSFQSVKKFVLMK